MLTKDLFIYQLKKLISIKSVSTDRSECSRVLDHITSLVSEHVQVNRFNKNGFESLILSNTKTLTPDLAYVVHADVVAGSQEQFSMKVKDDRAYGRGTDDMKYSIPIGIALLNEITDNQETKKFSFAMVITTDEELGGENGVKFLVEEIKFRPKVAIVPDAGNNFRITNKSKGALQLKIISKGKAAHAGYIWQGKNANEALCKLAVKLLEKYDAHNKKESWQTTMNIGKIHGGNSINQVCDHAEMYLDFRFPETTTAIEIFNEVKNLAKTIDKNLSVELDSQADFCFTDPDLEVVKLFSEALEKEIGKKPEIKATYGTGDYRFFGKYDIPVLMSKPWGEDLHGPNEWINIESSMKFYQALRNFVKLYRQSL